MGIFKKLKALEEPVEPDEKKRAAKSRITLLESVMQLQRTADEVRTELARLTLEAAARG